MFGAVIVMTVPFGRYGVKPWEATGAASAATKLRVQNEIRFMGGSIVGAVVMSRQDSPEFRILIVAFGDADLVVGGQSSLVISVVPL